MARPGQFAQAVKEFAKAALQKESAVFISTAAQMRESIRYGSALTGAPPMPVAAKDYSTRRRRRRPPGTLRDSVTLAYPDANTAIVYTTNWFAPLAEDNPDGFVWASGASHGWKQTHAAFGRIVETTAARQAGAT